MTRVRSLASQYSNTFQKEMASDTHTHTHTRVRTHTYTHKRTCMHELTHTHTHSHTHSHTRRLLILTLIPCRSLLWLNSQRWRMHEHRSEDRRKHNVWHNYSTREHVVAQIAHRGNHCKGLMVTAVNGCGLTSRCRWELTHTH